MAEIFNDPFTASNQDLSAYGNGWLTETGDFDIDGNRLLCATDGWIYNTTSVGASDYEALVDIILPTDASHFVIVAARMQGASKRDNNYCVYFQSETGSGGSHDFMELLKRVAGVQTLLGSRSYISGITTGNHQIGVSANGTTIEAKYEGVTKVSVTDSSLSGEGDFGMRGNTGRYYDNYIVNDFSIGGLPVLIGGGIIQS